MPSPSEILEDFGGDFMINIPIDEFSCIVQPYFDGGDSYKDNKKYSLVPKYKTMPEGCLKQTWEGIRVDVEPCSSSVIETDNLNIDISDFTRFRIFANISKNIRVKLYCNGELVIDEQCGGKIENIDGKTERLPKTINSLRYEFINSSEILLSATIHYLGLINDKIKNKNTFTGEWEGFFSENPSYEMFDNLVMTDEELERLRKNITKEPLKSMYEKAKNIALKKMEECPEKEIKRTVANFFREPNNINGLIELAVVGQIDKNEQMLKMACRYALSIASCEYWCADPMETAPAITWHHRSFTESAVASQVSTVISLAGNCLSWHGRNYLYNMIIMKALPRMEADFMTMEYIYHMNQGIAFMSGYVQALAVLSNNYPRYKRRLDEAEILLEEMLENAFAPDGSSFEGASYWQYTMLNYLNCVYFLARCKGKSIKEYVGGRLNKTSDFALSLIDAKGYMLPVNDSGRNIYVRIISAMLYSITGDERWARLYHLKKEADDALTMCMINSINVPQSHAELTCGYVYLPVVGFSQICRDGIQLFASSGPSNSTHCHCDKGSFLVNKNGRAVIPDVTALYSDAEAGRLQKTQSHTLAVPVKRGKLLEQYHGTGYEAKIKKSSFENGVFEWQSDNSQMWDKSIVKSNVRTIFSDKSDEFIITDEFEFSLPMGISFRLNVINESDVTVEPVNWTPVSREYSELYRYNDEMAHQIILTSAEALRFSIVTKITIN